MKCAVVHFFLWLQHITRYSLNWHTLCLSSRASPFSVKWDIRLSNILKKGGASGQRTSRNQKQFLRIGRIVSDKVKRFVNVHHN